MLPVLGGIWILKSTRLAIVDILLSHVAGSREHGLLEPSIHRGIHLDVVRSSKLLRHVGLSVIVGLVASLLGSGQDSLSR